MNNTESTKKPLEQYVQDFKKLPQVKRDCDFDLHPDDASKDFNAQDHISQVLFSEIKYEEMDVEKTIEAFKTVACSSEVIATFPLPCVLKGLWYQDEEWICALEFDDFPNRYLYQKVSQAQLNQLQQKADQDGKLRVGLQLRCGIYEIAFNRKINEELPVFSFAGKGNDYQMQLADVGRYKTHISKPSVGGNHDL